MLDFAYAFPLGNDSIADAGRLGAVRIQLVSSWTSEDCFWPEIYHQNLALSTLGVKVLQLSPVCALHSFYGLIAMASR